MDLAQEMVRSCLRAFYDTKHILVIDALIRHAALRDDDMAYLMSMNTKELHKLCGRLKEDRFLAVHNRAEFKEGQQRPLNRTYYYLDYRATIDAIKWRVYCIDKAVQGTTIPEDQRTEYSCARCKSKWTVMEVVPFMINEGFGCPKCSFPLHHDVGENQSGHEQSTKLNAQFRFITELLQKIDAVVIPENTFEQAFATRLKVERDATNPAYETAPLDTSENRPTAVKGMANTGPTNIVVTLTTGEGPTEADRAADLALKEKILSQNALPQHFTHSTISGEQVKFGQQPTLQTSSFEADVKNVDTLSVNADEAGIDDYFAQLKAEQAREAEKELDEEEETDDEDEDDFEDVPTGSAATTPGPSVAVSGVDDDGKVVKKIKIEEREESDEDLEFEDV